MKKTRHVNRPDAPRRFRLAGQFLCHDLRMCRRVETVVEREEAPTLAEATQLLWTVAAAEVDERDKDCPFELSDVSVTPAAE